jgi:hypothetical protein
MVDRPKVMVCPTATLAGVIAPLLACRAMLTLVAAGAAAGFLMALGLGMAVSFESQV